MREGRAGPIRSDSTADPHCPLCGRPDSRPFAEAHARTYFRCARCGLVFLAPWQRPDPESERARYEIHENDPSDAGYRRFLDRLAAPLAERLPAGSSGLDFGCGPGPTLSVMMEERGFRMEIYDPFFEPDEDVLDRTYDFITCSEVAEHLFYPGRELERLGDMLRPGGWLGLMTQVLDDDRDFETWHYVRDRTHVCFYAPETLEWIGSGRGWRPVRPSKDVWLFRRADAASDE